MKIRGTQDFCAGLLFTCFGALALFIIIVRDYPVGTAANMGPAYMPIMVAGLLLLFGLIVLVRGLSVTANALNGLPLRAIAFILLAIALFAVTVERLGIVAAVLLVVLASVAARPGFHWREALLLTVTMVALAVGLFTQALGLPFRLLPF